MKESEIRIYKNISILTECNYNSCTKAIEPLLWTIGEILKIPWSSRTLYEKLSLLHYKLILCVLDIWVKYDANFYHSLHEDDLFSVVLVDEFLDLLLESSHEISAEMAKNIEDCFTIFLLQTVPGLADNVFSRFIDLLLHESLFVNSLGVTLLSEGISCFSLKIEEKQKIWKYFLNLTYPEKVLILPEKTFNDKTSFSFSILDVSCFYPDPGSKGEIHYLIESQKKNGIYWQTEKLIKQIEWSL